MYTRVLTEGIRRHLGVLLPLPLRHGFGSPGSVKVVLERGHFLLQRPRALLL